MPVFARTKLIMYDTCFPDPGDIVLKYVGPNPQKLYERVYELLKTVWRASDADIQEEEYNWGAGEKEKFSVRWFLHKDIDRFTYFYVKIGLSGQGDKKSGGAKLKFKPILMTEYPQDTVWQRSLIYEMVRTFWHRAFYHNKRMEYMVECRNLTSFFIKKTREYFKQLKEESES